jgi:hypothetical protein
MKKNVSSVVTSTSLTTAEIWRAKRTVFTRYAAGLLHCLPLLMIGLLAQAIFCPASWAQTPASSGTALSFGAVNQRVSVSLTSPPATNYTISAWVYLRSGGTSDNPMAVLSSTTCGASIELLICSANGSTNGPQYLGLERCNNFFGPLSSN